jgi:prevent-host-death family protein
MPAARHQDREVGVRELRANLSRHLTDVAEGATLTVTDRGRPVARLVGVDRDPPGLERLVARGGVRLPTRPASDPSTWRRPRPAGSVADVVAAQRR